MLEPIELRQTDLPDAAAVLLAPPGTGRAAREQVDSFLTYVEKCPVHWRGWRCGGVQRPAAVALVILIPGRTSMLMQPTAGVRGVDPEAQFDLARRCLDQLRGEQLHYVQTLADPGAAEDHAQLARLGFRPLAPLSYLERSVAYPWVDPPQPLEAEWIPFGDDTYDLFADTILNTYRDSQDCPELTALRPIEDVIASHQASGIFDPTMWEVAKIDDGAAGCILTSRLPHASSAEVVYMGVTPEFRRRGVGRLLLRRALSHCRNARLRRLTIVVDDRNDPAKRLYESFSLRSAAMRIAYLFQWK